MTRTRRAAVLTCAIASITSTLSHARETYMLTNRSHVWGEIEGATAPIPHPALLFQTNIPSVNPGAKAITSDGTAVHILVSDGISSSVKQRLYTFDLSTGTQTGNVAVQLPMFDNGLHDIVTVGGEVYASWQGFPRELRVRRINRTDGSLTDVFSTSHSDNFTTAHLAANAATNTIVLTPAAANGPSKRLLLNPNTWTVTSTTNANTSPGLVSVLNLAGNRITEDTRSAFSLFANSQITRTVPGFVSLGERPMSSYLGRAGGFVAGIPGPGHATAISDAIDHPYPSSLPAVVELNPLFHWEGDPETRVLVRRPGSTFSLPLRISNFATPDDTAVDQVAATDISWNQAAGGTPIQVAASPDPAGDLSTRRIAQAHFAIPSDATPVRGVYTLIPNVTLQGRYTSSGQQSTRTLHVYNPTRFNFAVDPPSDNLLGNGDFDLGEYGWDGGVATTALLLPGNVGSQRIAGQVLELGTPDSALLLSFDYNAWPSTVANLIVRLNGITVATLSGISPTTTNQHFSAQLDDPRLRNLTNPRFEFEAVHVSGTSPMVIIDNASLVAIPEPASISLLMCAPILLRRRRQPQSPSNNG